MHRTLWLQYERPPHADAVIYPASEADVKLALAALTLPYPERCRLAVCLILLSKSIDVD